MRIAIRTTAAAGTGTGHLVRCRHIARGLAAGGAHVLFLVDGTEAALALLEDESFEVVPLPPARGEGLAETEVLASDHAPVDLLLVDHFGLGAAYEARMRPWAHRVAVIDGMLREHDCDIWIDPSVRASAPHAAHNARPCRVLSGLEHLPVGPAFARVRPAGPSSDGNFATPGGRILLSFGGFSGVDPSPVLQALEDAVFAGEVVAVSLPVPDFPPRPYRIVRHDWVNDMPGLLAGVDLAVGACGASAWERCAAGVPSLAFCIAGNQEHVGRLLADRNAAVVFDAPPDRVPPDQLATRLAALLADPALRRTLRDHARGLCDGKGVERIVRALLDR